MQAHGTNSFMMVMLIGMIILIALPAITWLLMPDRSDQKARTWFIGAILQGVAGVLFLGQFTEFGEYLLTASRICSAISLNFFVTVLRAEAGRKSRPREILGFSLFQYAAYVLVEYGLGEKFQSFILMQTWFVLATGYLAGISLVIARRMRSRSMLAIGLGFAAAFLSNLLRTIAAIVTGKSALLAAMDVTAAVATSLLFICAVLYCFGYWGFCFEQVFAREQQAIATAADARARQEVAEAQAEEMSALLAERDRMMILNSRFSALSALSVFNGALVHEFAQPLQAVRSAIDVLLLVNPLRRSELETRLSGIQQLVDKMEGLLTVFRGMLRNNPPVNSPVEPSSVLGRLLPIVEAELARRDGVLQVAGLKACRDLKVRCNAAMLERVIINLAVNAMDAMERNPIHQERRLSFELFWEAVGQGGELVLRTVDTGPGIDPEILEKLFEPLETGSAVGIGLGLTLVRAIVESWGGKVAIRSPEYGTFGTSVEIRLPAMDREGLPPNWGEA